MSLARRNGARRLSDDRTVEVDRDDDAERYRYVCPNGHVNWSKTNSHIWCRQCRRLIESGNDDVDAEHYEILDKSEDVLIPWDQVELI